MLCSQVGFPPHVLTIRVHGWVLELAVAAAEYLPSVGDRCAQRRQDDHRDQLREGILCLSRCLRSSCCGSAGRYLYFKCTATDGIYR